MTEDKTKSDLVEVQIIGSQVIPIVCPQCGFPTSDSCSPCVNCGWYDCDS